MGKSVIELLRFIIVLVPQRNRGDAIDGPEAALRVLVRTRHW
jgi:hypothetical protein